MFKKTSFIAFCLCTAVFTGCQTSSELQCAELNWRDDGEKTALSGEPMAKNLDALKLKCKKFVSTPELENYKEGFERGLAQLCTAQKGFDFGENGQKYKDTCPDFRKNNFLKGYYKGKLEFLTSRLKKIEGLYNSSEERVWRKEREYTIIQSQDPERAKLEADVLESYREEARSLAQLSVDLKKEIINTKKLFAESFF